MDGKFEPVAPIVDTMFHQEVGIAGVTITLTGTDVNGNAINLSQQTGADGSYAFDGLLGGTYTVTQTQPPTPTMTAGRMSGYYDGFVSPGSAGGTVTAANVVSGMVVGAGTQATGYNFGEIPPADPFGFVFVDVNCNGRRDPGIANVPVTISGTAFAGPPLARPITGADVPGGRLTVLTDANGRYEIAPIPPGLSSLTEAIQPAGFLDGREENADTNPPATVVVGNDRFGNVVVNPFPIRGPFNFGELRPARLAGRVTLDGAGLGAVQVVLTGTTTFGVAVRLSTFSAADGSFSFAGLPPGTSDLIEVQPAGLADAGSRAGSAGGIAEVNAIRGIRIAGVTSATG
jgi:hypothetical protein